MNRFPKDSFLPELRELGISEFNRFRRALVDTFRDVALVTREIQAPPICAVDLNGSDQNLTVTVTNIPAFVTTRSGAIDTHGWWDNTNYRYTPKETGYYVALLHVTLNYATTGLVTAGNIRTRIRKNAVGESITRIDTDAATAIVRSFESSKIIYCNGTTDYIDFSIIYSAGTALTMLGAHNESYATIMFLGGDQVA